MGKTLRNTKTLSNFRAIKISDPEYIKFIERSSTEITVPDGTTKIGAYSFYYYNDTYVGTGKGVKNVTLPNSVNTIGKYAFCQCSQLENISSTNLENVEASAFYSCSNLKSIGSTSNLKIVYANAFVNCSNLEISDLSNISTVQDYAFSGCKKLTANTFHNLNTTMGEYCFKGCSGISGKLSLKGNNTLDNNCHIGKNAFQDCTGITEFEYLASCYMYGIGRTISIGANAFNGCSSLTKMSFPNATSIPTLSNVNALPNGVNWAGTIEVPSALLAEWKASTNWGSLTNATFVGI